MRRTRTWLGTLIMLGACGSTRDDAPVDDAGVVPGAEARVDAATPTPRDAAAPPAFSVDVTSSRAELCAGECAELTASARNASASVGYAWSDSLPAAASQRVCPTATHTYQVDATASAASGEFTSEQKASDRITVSVRDCTMAKPDVLCELRHRFDYPADGDVFKASKPWVNLDTYSGSGAVRTTPDGGAWLVGSFARELDLGAGRIEANAPMSTFLHKIDASCKPVRTLLLSASTAGDTILPGAIAVDAQGNAYVASIAGPLVEYNLLSSQPIRWTRELLVEKFSPTGESLYRYRIASGIGGMFTDIDVNAAGEVFASGLIPENTDLGSGLPVGLSFSTYRTFALKLSAEGRYAAQRVNTGAYQIALAGDRAYHVSVGITSFDVLAAVLFGYSAAEPQARGVLATRQADLGEHWQAPFDDLDNPGAAATTARGELAVVFDRQTAVDNSAVRRANVLRRYEASGKPAREHTFIDRTIVDMPPEADAGLEAHLTYVSDSFVFPFLDESEPDTLVLGGQFNVSQTLAGTMLINETRQIDYGNGVVRFGIPGSVVIKLDQNDAIRWVRQQDFGAETNLRGLASMPSGEVWVAGQARVKEAPTDGAELEYDLVVRKLRAD